MSGFIGDIVDEDVVAQDIMGTGEGKTYLFPHLLFTFGMNKDRIVSATVHTDSSQKVDITNVDKPLTVSFIGTFRKGLHYQTWIYPCSYCHHLLTDICRCWLYCHKAFLPNEWQSMGALCTSDSSPFPFTSRTCVLLC